jgi:hypothetical protein
MIQATEVVLQRKLARGGFGEVHKEHDTLLPHS